ncbi:unnamed protein product, partial [marine sediment metagenome]
KISKKPKTKPSKKEVIKEALKLGIKAAVQVPGVTKISAGNYGGKLGKFQYRLYDILA